MLQRRRGLLAAQKNRTARCSRLCLMRVLASWQQACTEPAQTAPHHTQNRMPHFASCPTHATPCLRQHITAPSEAHHPATAGQGPDPGGGGPQNPVRGAGEQPACLTRCSISLLHPRSSCFTGRPHDPTHPLNLCSSPCARSLGLRRRRSTWLRWTTLRRMPSMTRCVVHGNSGNSWEALGGRCSAGAG